MSMPPISRSTLPSPLEAGSDRLGRIDVALDRPLGRVVAPGVVGACPGGLCYVHGAPLPPELDPAAGEGNLAFQVECSECFLQSRHDLAPGGPLAVSGPRAAPAL